MSLFSKSGHEDLDRGEIEAIALAEQYKPEVLLLLDEEAGRAEAKRRNIRITGILGLLDDAASRGLIDLQTVIGRLRNTNFRATDALLESLLARDRQRREQ